MSPMPNFSASLDDHEQQQLNDDEHRNEPLRTSISIETTDDSADGSAAGDPSPTNFGNDLCASAEDPATVVDDDSGRRSTEKNSLPRDTSVDVLASEYILLFFTMIYFQFKNCVDRLMPLCTVDPSIWNAPMPIFTAGNLCLPYLSLPYMDLLTDSSVHGYTIGTSNILFQQKRQLTDVFVDIEGAGIETANVDIRKQLTLSTEDLRFVDFIVRHVQSPREDAEGSEQWIRDQFRAYMLAMLRTSLAPVDSKEPDNFNALFMAAWRSTPCYQSWYDAHCAACRTPDERRAFDDIQSGHPFAGTLSVADMKLKIAQSMNNSESGRKINQAVNTTSKAVGGAISTAKGALSNWWSAMTTQPPPLSNESTSTQQTTIDDDGDTNDLVAKKESIMYSVHRLNETEATTDVLNECARFKRSENKENMSTSEGIIEIGHDAAATVNDTNRRKSGEIFIA